MIDENSDKNVLQITEWMLKRDKNDEDEVNYLMMRVIEKSNNEN